MQFLKDMKLLEKSAELGVTMEGGLDKRLTIIKTKNKETSRDW